jgi:hypothetical protein
MKLRSPGKGLTHNPPAPKKFKGLGSVCVCLLLQDLVQRCLHGGGGDMGGHVLRESNNVDPLVSGFGQIYLTVKYI